MATSAERRLRPKEIRRFGTLHEHHGIPDLTEIQTRSYQAFLQLDAAVENRKDEGLEGVLREIFNAPPDSNTPAPPTTEINRAP